MRDWVCDVIGARIGSVRLLCIASTAVHAVDAVDAQGRSLRLVLRRFFDSARLANDPWYVPSREADILRWLAGSGLPVPALVASDVDGSFCGVPTLLTTKLAGRPPGMVRDPTSFLRQMASVLVRIHAVDAVGGLGLVPYEPYFAPGELKTPSWSIRPGLWKSVLDALAGPPPATASCFIHRDYHFGNTLWRRGALTGVVDWTTGCLGPPGIDLARMRINLAWHFAVEWADAFLDAYRSAGGDASAYHPYWDLLDAADFLGDTSPPEHAGASLPRDAGQGTAFARFEDLVERVLKEL